MNQNKIVLEEIEKGLDMGVQSIEAIENHIQNEAMKVVVEKQKGDYLEAINQAQRLAMNMEERSSGNALQTAMLKSMIKMKTMMDDSDDRIAEMLIQGGNKLLIELNQIKNEYVNHEQVSCYIENLLEDEQRHIDALKPFL